VVGNGDARFQVVVGAPGQLLERETPSEDLVDGLEHLDGFGGDVFPDAVAGDDCDVHDWWLLVVGCWLLVSRRARLRQPPPPMPCRGRGGRTALRGGVLRAGAPSRRAGSRESWRRLRRWGGRARWLRR